MFSATGTHKFLSSCEAVTELKPQKGHCSIGKQGHYFHFPFRELRHYATSRAKLGNGGQETRKNQLPCPDRETNTLLSPPRL